MRQISVFGSIGKLFAGLLAVALLAGAIRLSVVQNASAGDIVESPFRPSDTHFFDGAIPEWPQPENDRSSLLGSNFMHPCLFGGCFGSRHIEMPGQLLVLRRLAVSDVLRSAWGHRENARSPFGMVRPHLFFCRFRN